MIVEYCIQGLENRLPEMIKHGQNVSGKRGAGSETVDMYYNTLAPEAHVE